MRGTPSTSADRRVDGSMSLLVDMMTNTLDESYASAARKRSEAGRQAAPDGPRPAPGSSRRATAILLLVALGLVTGTAAAQVRNRQRAGSSIRTQLVDDVSRRTAESDGLARQAAGLRREVTRLQDAALSSNSAGADIARQVRALQQATGVVPVTGPGLVVRLDDAPGSDKAATNRGGQAAGGRVLDRDLQDAVNGLWSAGAEAVSINDLRLTALTAIRSAGEAILVDYRPLSPPYTLRAIGDPGRLEAGFADSEAGRRLATYTSLYGLRLTTHRSTRQSLPGAGAPVLQQARPIGARP
jgi:uncharacterized protein YlxW (UPF0749 family)